MPVGAAATLMTRPERVEVIAEGDADSLPMSIAKRVFQGERILFDLTAPGGQVFQSSVPSIEKFRRMQTGDRVGARFQECRAIPASQP
jgi:ABC-type Fe3+/spermidine/putrescine transport system ATPase subunit